MAKKINTKSDTKTKKLIPVIDKDDVIYYVTEFEFSEFIRKNSRMSDDKCREYMKKHDLALSLGEEKVLWKKEGIIKQAEYHNEHQTKWVTAFFEAHPFMDKFMVVFD